MKRAILFLVLFTLLLSGCSGDEAETTVPVITEPTVTTTAPTEPATVPAEAPPAIAPTEPTETEAPTEPAETQGFQSYTVSISDPEKPIYEGPAFLTNCVDLVWEAGVYTIVEEAEDSDGNLWGRLKSGIGWICLTEPAIVPVYADYAPEHFVYAHSWHCGEADYVTDMGIIPMESMTDVRIVLLNVLENYAVDEVLYQADSLDAEEALKISVVFWGDFTTYGIQFTDANGLPRYFALSISGKDGSLICSEYQPE